MDLPTTHYDAAKVETETPQVKSHEAGPNKKNKLEKIASYVFLITVFLAPLAFIPSVYASFDAVKTTVIAIGVLLSCILYAISSIKYRTISLPRNAFVYVSITLVLSLLISTATSANILRSFFGQGFEIGTASFLILMFITSYLVTRLSARNKEMTLSIYTCVLAVFGILALVHIARFIGGPDVLTFGIFKTATATMIGKWFDFSILTAVATLTSFFGIKFLSLGNGLKVLLWIVLCLAGILLFVINFAFIWIALAIIFLCFGIYEYKHTVAKASSTGIGRIVSRISVVTVIVFVIALVLAAKGNILTQKISDKLAINQGELVLPWQYTLDIGSNTIKEAPLFGAGPNRFSYQFFKYKPLGINPSQYWSTEFTSGFGNIPTFIVGQGLVGFVLWILFFIFFIGLGVKALRTHTDSSKKFSVVSTFLIASFLWIMNIIYIPSHFILFLTFILTGLFIASLLPDASGAASTSEAKIKVKEIGAGSLRVRKFIPIISLISLIVLVIWFASYTTSAIAITHFQKGIKELNTTRDLAKAEASFKKAIANKTSDVYYQALSEVDIMKITALAQTLQTQAGQNPANAVTPADQKIAEQIASLINEAVGYTKTAVTIDPTNYYNYIAQARISELAASFKVPNAYENAKQSYINALQVNPYNPSLYLNLARLEASQNKLVDAEKFVGQALQVKQNYTEAVFLLSQIQVSNGQTKDALISAQVATQLNPNDPILFFQLGILAYSDKDYARAATALEQAVKLNPQYANARYFLGLSYARLARNQDAIAQFVELTKTNPDNKEVAFILSNLQAGRSPFTDVQPPIDNKPEKRKTLPVADKASTTKTPVKPL